MILYGSPLVVRPYPLGFINFNMVSSEDSTLEHREMVNSMQRPYYAVPEVSNTFKLVVIDDLICTASPCPYHKMKAAASASRINYQFQVKKSK